MASSVSACLIVRNEQDRLERCVWSVAPFVDEVVICDTGSTDETPAIARRIASRFVAVDWSDDFAAARNAATAECRSDWVFSIDADEVATGALIWIPQLLAACEDELDALFVRIENVTDLPGPKSHTEQRLFRREWCEWRGRVHERLARRDGAELRSADFPQQTLTLVHDGYRDESVARAKAHRNAALAERNVAELFRRDAPAGDIARAAFDLGRSLIACGLGFEARSALIVAQQLASGDPETRDVYVRAGEILDS